jgi:copper chaperone CopZ
MKDGAKGRRNFATFHRVTEGCGRGLSFDVPRFTTIARIGGMRSVHCARAVYTALAAIPGITGAEVVVGQATVDHDGQATTEALRAAIAVAGYELLETTEERQRTLPLL